jgi:hypothetical protein
MKVRKIPKKYESFIVEMEKLFDVQRPQMSLLELESKREFELMTGDSYNKKLLGYYIANFIVMWSAKYYQQLGLTHKKISEVMKHEIVHLFFRKKFGTNKPKWLNEALAIHLSGAKPKKEVPMNLQISDLITLHSNDSWKVENMNLSYRKSYEMVKRILQNDLNGGKQK